MQLECSIRVARLTDLEVVIRAFNVYNRDEALAKCINAGEAMENSEALRNSLINLIENQNIMIALGESDQDIYGLTVFYEKHGLPNPESGEEDKSTNERIEEHAILSAKEVGMEDLAPIFSICDQCVQLETLGSETLIYLEGLGVLTQFRGKGVASKLVKAFEEEMMARGYKNLISCATSIGTEKILERQGWQAYNTLNTKDFEYKGEKTFASIDLDVKAYKKTL